MSGSTIICAWSTATAILDDGVQWLKLPCTTRAAILELVPRLSLKEIYPSGIANVAWKKTTNAIR